MLSALEEPSMNTQSEFSRALYSLNSVPGIAQDIRHMLIHLILTICTISIL